MTALSSIDTSSIVQSEVQLQVIELATGCQPCQTLVIDLLAPLQGIKPDTLSSLQLPPDLDLQREVLLFGSGPNWLYGYLTNQCRQAPWVATYDLRSQSAVVACSNVADVAPGDVIPVLPNPVTPNPAILIGGPPSSGKSVFSHALKRNLLKAQPTLKTHIYRANWDGEGDHTYETPNPELVEQLRRENNAKLHHQPESAAKIQKFFGDRAKEAQKIRCVIDLTLVDVGGIPDPVKAPVVEQCTHYIVISRDANEIPKWHDLCHPTLKPLAVIHSVLEERFEILQTEPFLEAIAGPWIRGQESTFPEILLNQILEIIG
jgi:CRISPR-associated protein Csx3